MVRTETKAIASCCSGQEVLNEGGTMKPEDAVRELAEVFGMTLTATEEQRIVQILERLWESARNGSGGAKTVNRVGVQTTRHTIPNI